MNWFSLAAILSYDKIFNFVVGNRGGGKTFNSMDFLINRFKKTGEQWAYIRRTETELDAAIGKGLFKDLQAHGKFADDEFKVENNIMYCNGQEMGACIALSQAHKFKGSGFPYLMWLLYDEFIPEPGTYKLKDEIGKLLGLVETIGRLRRVRVIFLANSLTINNVYFDFFGIRPKRGAKFTKHPTKSIIIQLYVNEEQQAAKRESEFGQLMAGTKYAEYMIDNRFLLDNYDFIETSLSGRSVYQCSLHYNGHSYGVYWYEKLGVFHISDNVVKSCNMQFSFTTEDHSPNFILFDVAKKNPYIKRLIRAYEIGRLRFVNMTCKNDMYELFQYL